MDIKGQRPRGNNHSGLSDYENRADESFRDSPTDRRRHASTQYRNDSHDDKGEAAFHVYALVTS